MKVELDRFRIATESLPCGWTLVLLMLRYWCCLGTAVMELAVQRAASDLPDLREDHLALINSGDPGVDRYALVNIETDRITNSLNTLTLEVYRWDLR